MTRFKQVPTTSAGSARALSLSPTAREALRELLFELSDDAVSLQEFRRRWQTIDLAPAGGMPQLAAVVEDYFRLQAEGRPAMAASIAEALSLIAVSLGGLCNGTSGRPADLPIPAGSPHNQAKQLPLPVKQT